MSFVINIYLILLIGNLYLFLKDVWFLPNFSYVLIDGPHLSGTCPRHGAGLFNRVPLEAGLDIESQTNTKPQYKTPI